MEVLFVSSNIRKIIDLQVGNNLNFFEAVEKLRTFKQREESYTKLNYLHLFNNYVICEGKIWNG